MKWNDIDIDLDFNVTNKRCLQTDAGVYVVQGYINGMLSKSESVWNAAYELGVKALETAKYATDTKE